ncbi:MAG: hypothetical protein HY711_05035 [Candidatus Melainabacteria bacterium]|nr:hypothetical protein [Candidatus Melainabacteria bacterium]
MGGERGLERQQGNSGAGNSLDSSSFFSDWTVPEKLPVRATTDLLGLLQETGSPRNRATIDLLQGWRSPETSPTKTIPDRPLESPVKNGVLELRYGEPDFDRKLACGYDYKTLRITGKPANAQLLVWGDEKGYYFFFKNGDQTPHHFPAKLKVIDIDGKSYDVDRARLRVSESYMSQFSGETNGFATVNYPKGDVMSYFWKLSRMADDGLVWQEQLLREQVQQSDNPYFKLYLADILFVESFSPLIRGVLQDSVTPEQKQQMLKKIDEANQLLREVRQQSDGSLRQKNHFPQSNAAMPLAPGAFLYMPPTGTYYDPYFAFWAGAYDQAGRRELFFTFARGLITSNAYRFFQLPPNELPR